MIIVEIRFNYLFFRAVFFKFLKCLCSETIWYLPKGTMGFVW